MKTKIKKVMITTVVLALILTVTTRADWTLTVIPDDVTVPASWTGGVEVTDISNNGIVCGIGNYVINTSSTAFRFDSGIVTELPHLNPSEPMSYAKGINSSGVICGYSRNAAGKSQACYWAGTAINTIPYPPDAETDRDFRAYAINDDGVIVGYAYKETATDVYDQMAFYYQNGVTYSLDAAIRAAGLANHQMPSAVNDNGVICGTAWDTAEIRHPWTYDINTGTLTVLPIMGDFFKYNTATAINNEGKVLGYGKIASALPNQAFVYDGSWTTVDSSVTTGHFAKAINDWGRMINVNASGSLRWSWYSDAPGAGSMVDISVSGEPTDWYYESVETANNAGWMVGSGKILSSVEKKGFILAPPPGDGDVDGDVNLDDVAVFVDCMSGPIGAAGFVAPSIKCLSTFDFAPADGDVDLQDFAEFQRVFSN